MPDHNDLVAQERAAIVTMRLFINQQITPVEVRELTGLSQSGIWYLMGNIARVVPLWYDDQAMVWHLVSL